MFRGKVTASDDRGVYVRTSEFGIAGPLTWLGVEPAVGASVLLADAGDNPASPDLIVMGVTGGTASTVDNSVARFDGTGGALQGSGVTIDDSGQTAFPHDIYVARSGASSQVHVTGASGQWSSLVLRGGASGVERWTLTKNNATESGSDAGSNLQLYRYTDAGSGTLTLEVNRATGKITLVDVGSAAGLEFGASGPRDMAGSGSPEGVVTAPIGSTWRQTNHADLGYCKWVKATGAGNTGWLPDFEGRWVAYTPSLTNLSGGSVSGKYTRQGKTITFRAQFIAGTVGTDPQIGIPVASPSSYRLPCHAQLGGPSFYEAIGQIYDTTVRIYYTSDSNGGHGSIGATMPFTWTTNNQINVNGTYDAA